MNKSDSYDAKLSQARGLASQLGMFAEENDIPKDLASSESQRSLGISFSSANIPSWLEKPLA